MLWACGLSIFDNCQNQTSVTQSRLHEVHVRHNDANDHENGLYHVQEVLVNF